VGGNFVSAQFQLTLNISILIHPIIFNPLLRCSNSVDLPLRYSHTQFLLIFLPFSFIFPSFSISGFDDALDAFGVHAIGGIIGGLSTGFFATDQVASPFTYGEKRRIFVIQYDSIMLLRFDAFIIDHTSFSLPVLPIYSWNSSLHCCITKYLALCVYI
jgi:Ammonium Transporter Family